MTSDHPKILVYGYGNPGRQDDALGIELAEEIGRWSKDAGMKHVHTDVNYQLNLEDAAGIAGYDAVIFADASKGPDSNFRLEALKSSDKAEFTMHAVSPAYILYLCETMFGHVPRAYLLHIRGFEWEFMEGMTDGAIANLKAATAYLKDFIGEMTHT